MNHLIFKGEDDTISVDTVILVRVLSRSNIHTHYVSKLTQKRGLYAFDLKYDDHKKVSAKTIREYCEELLLGLSDLGIKTLYVCDSNYFKYLAGVKKVSDCYNEVLPCAVKGYEHMNCILGVNYQALVYDPKMKDKLEGTVKTLDAHLLGSFKSKELIPNTAIMQEYPDAMALHKMLDAFRKVHKTLAIDIETTGLRFNEATIESIAFAYSDKDGYATIIRNDIKSKRVLKNFFEKYEGECVYHNGLFDIKILIYHLFMEHSADFMGMLEGIRVMTKNIHDTMLMTFLVTNNTQGNELGLKPNTVGYTGNYAENVKDVTKIPVADLLLYNLRDTLATFWFYNKCKAELVTEGQVDIYEKIFLPSIPTLLEMMLVGLPMDISQLDVIKRKLESTVRSTKSVILKHHAVKTTIFNTAIVNANKANAKLKKKLKSISEFMEPFNPNSNNQKTELFYEVLKLPVIDTTDSGLPSCSGKTLKKLLKQIDDEDTKELLQAFIDYMDAEKILGTFIKAFENFAFNRARHHWLNGNHKLGGTLSGRLSSTEPNLANLPSNSKYGKDIKSIFKAPEGWLFCGSDFSALEDRVVAILSKDPNKIRIFKDKIDGHCLNAYGYYSDQMPDIDPDDPNSINSIADKYPKLRQDSKASTFALNYGGTALTLHVNNGLPMDQAIKVEEGHKIMYKVLHDWSQENKLKMAKDGYISCAFGLKVRTPMLAKSLIDSKVTPSQVKAEFRSGNNAVTQSHGLMTTNAGIMFRERLECSKYRHDVLMINFIHDAIYLLVREDTEVLEWVNKNLIECMVNSGDSQVHGNKDVPILADLEIGISWDKQYALPLNAAQDEIAKVLRDKVHGTG